MAQDSETNSKEWKNVLGREDIKVSSCSKSVNKTAENYFTYCGGSLWI